MRTKFICALFLCVTLFACKKEDKPRSELILGSWVITSIAVSPAIDYDEDGDVENEIFPLEYETCEQDNEWTFKSGGMLEYGTGAMICDDETTETVTWSLTNEDKEIVIDGEKANLAQLDDKTMVIAIDDYLTEGSNSVSGRITFRKL